MKYKALILLISFSFAGLFFLSCKKYDEGPLVSFRTKMNRITGTWIITEISRDGSVIQEFNTDNNNIEITLEKDETGYIEIFASFLGSRLKLLTAKLTWKFTKDKEYLNITLKSDEIEWNEDFSDLDLENLFPDNYEDFEFNDDILIDIFNVEAKILRLTNKELWLENEAETNGIVSIMNYKMNKTD